MKKLLLPIRPKYVNQILAGTKKVEYRTKIRKLLVSFVYQA